MAEEAAVVVVEAEKTGEAAPLAVPAAVRVVELVVQRVRTASDVRPGALPIP